MKLSITKLNIKTNNISGIRIEVWGSGSFVAYNTDHAVYEVDGKKMKMVYTFYYSVHNKFMFIPIVSTIK